MTDDGYGRAKGELEDLGQRIEACIRDLREKGELSGAHEAYLHEAKIRRARVEEKIAAALREGKLITAIKEEALRDYRGIFDGMDGFTEWLDAQLMKMNGH